VNLPPAKSVSSPVALLLSTVWLLFATGCYLPDGGPAYGSPGYVEHSTCLVIVMQGEATREQYEARRAEIIDYLIERGYISSEGNLLADPDQAERVIRAIVNPEGGFTLSVFDRSAEAGGPPPELWDTDLLYPADPYFILGFVYINEIGPRHLPPRPPGYRPHPHPPSYRPPPGQHVWDYARHWSDHGARGDGDHRRPRGDRDDDHRSPSDRPRHSGHDDRSSPPPSSEPTTPTAPPRQPERFGRFNQLHKPQPPPESERKSGRTRDDDNSDHRRSHRDDDPPATTTSRPPEHFDRSRPPQATSPSTPPVGTPPRETSAPAAPPHQPGERFHSSPPPPPRPAPPPPQKSDQSPRAEPASNNDERNKHEN
jgi:hypothetical protein